MNLQNDIRNRVGAPSPLVYSKPGILKKGTHWCTGEEFEVSPQTNKLLAKAMGYENPVVTIHQMLAANYQIAVEYHKGVAVGIIVLRPFSVNPWTSGSVEGEPCDHVMIEGVYVAERIRNRGIGTTLLGAVKFRSEELGYKRIVFVRGPATHSLEDTLAAVRTPKECIFDELVNGHGYRIISLEFGASRPERCVLDINTHK